MPRECDAGGFTKEAEHERGDGVDGEPACGRQLARVDLRDGKPAKEHGGIVGPRGRGDGEVGGAREGSTDQGERRGGRVSSREGLRAKAARTVAGRGGEGGRTSKEELEDRIWQERCTRRRRGLYLRRR